MDWLGIKLELGRILVDQDALHIYAALAIQVVTAKLSRRSLGHFLPWLAVLGLELVNEGLDLVLGGESTLKPWQAVGAMHDIINTMILPSVLLILCRRDSALLKWGNDRGAR